MKHKKTICVDFDGVIHLYNSGWQGADQIPDPPVPGAIHGLHLLTQDPEIEVAIYSSRSSEPGGIEAMKKWLDTWEKDWREGTEWEQYDKDTVENMFRNVKYLSEKCVFPTSKPPAVVYIDDRGINFDGDWSKITADLKNYKPWNKR